jgi:hypothetical protein
MREQRLERQFTIAIEKQGGKALKFTSPGWSGAPDRIVLFPEGRIAFAELKAPGGKVRPLQQKRLQQLRNLGFYAEVIDSTEEIESFLKRAKGGGDK